VGTKPLEEEGERRRENESNGKRSSSLSSLSSSPSPCYTTPWIYFTRTTLITKEVIKTAPTLHHRPSRSRYRTFTYPFSPFSFLFVVGLLQVHPPCRSSVWNAIENCSPPRQTHPSAHPSFLFSISFSLFPTHILSLLSFPSFFLFIASRISSSINSAALL